MPINTKSFMHNFYHKLLPYIMVDIVIWWWNISYYFNLHPPTGTYIAILGFMVVIVTMLPSNHDSRVKAAWIFVFFCMTLLEITNLYNDDKQRAADRDKYDKQHTALVTEERNGFKDMFAQFHSLIERQEMLFNRQERLSKETLEKAKEKEGELVPANLPSPNAPCNIKIPTNSIALFLGNKCAAYITKFPHTVVQLDNEPLLTINKQKKGITLSGKFFSRDGKIVAKLKNNTFRISPNNYFYIERPDRHTLIVIGPDDEQTLNIQFINPSTIKILSEYYVPYQNPDLKLRPLIMDENSVRIGNFKHLGGCYLGGQIDFYFKSNGSFEIESGPEGGAAIGIGP